MLSPMDTGVFNFSQMFVIYINLDFTLKYFVLMLIICPFSTEFKSFMFIAKIMPV